MFARAKDTLPAFVLLMLPLVILSLAPAPVFALPPVEFELITENGFPLTGTRKWLQLFQDLDVRIRIRSAKLGEGPEITNRGTEQLPRYQVVGVLRADNKLWVPSGRFRLTDKARLVRWIDELRDGGIDALIEEKGAFGLRPNQLVAVHDALSMKVKANTRGRSFLKVAREIGRGVSLEFKLAALARPAFTKDYEIREEYAGLTAGTALAAMLRPLGLALVPERPRGGEVQLRITEIRAAKESWPVGWPPERAPGQTMPGLFRSLKVEIEATPLMEAVEAINERVAAPLLFDHYAISRKNLDPESREVSFAAKKTFYGKILRDIFGQAELTYKVRVDEAGTPFLWIVPRSPK